VRRNRARMLTVAAGAFLICLALAGCGRQGATSGPTTAELTAGPAVSASPASGDTTPAGSPSPSGSESPSPTAGPPTPDPVASELDQINQLINDINNSVDSSDTSQQDGE
jgi:hypothetical protein